MSNFICLSEELLINDVYMSLNDPLKLYLIEMTSVVNAEDYVKLERIVRVLGRPKDKVIKALQEFTSKGILEECDFGYRFKNDLFKVNLHTKKRKEVNQKYYENKKTKQVSLSKEKVYIQKTEEEKIKINYAEILNSYNKYLTSASRASFLTEKRKKLIDKVYASLSKKMATTDEEKIIGAFSQIFKEISQNDFYSGKSEKWKPNFDWFMNETNLVKVIESCKK